MDTETRLVAIDSEANGLCLSCTRLEAGSAKYQDLMDRLSSALRLCKFALAACFFFCILLVLMFSCSVYLFMEIQTVHQELSRLRTSQTIADDNSSSTSDVLYLLADDGLDIQVICTISAQLNVQNHNLSRVGRKKAFWTFFLINQ